MRRGYLIACVCCALALVLGLASCGGSATSDDDSSTTSTTSVTVREKPTEPESEPEEETPDTPEPAQGTPQISMTDVGMIHAHETDDGVGADVVIQVKNTGDVPLVLSDPSIKIGDESGTVVAEKTGDGIFTGPTYLGVGDVSFIYTNSPISLPKGCSADQAYLAQASADLAACKDVHQYPVSNLSIADDGHEVPVVTGTVTNDEGEEATLIELAAVFLDNEGKVLGVAGDFALEVAPGESQDFEIYGSLLPVGCTMPLISDYDVIAVAPKY